MSDEAAGGLHEQEIDRQWFLACEKVPITADLPECRYQRRIVFARAIYALGQRRRAEMDAEIVRHPAFENEPTGDDAYGYFAMCGDAADEILRDAGIEEASDER